MQKTTDPEVLSSRYTYNTALVPNAQAQFRRRSRKIVRGSGGQLWDCLLEIIEKLQSWNLSNMAAQIRSEPRQLQ